MECTCDVRPQVDVGIMGDSTGVVSALSWWTGTEMLHSNVILYFVYSRRYLVGDIEGGNRKCDGNDYHGK